MDQLRRDRVILAVIIKRLVLPLSRSPSPEMPPHSAFCPLFCPAHFSMHRLAPADLTLPGPHLVP